MNSGSCSIVIVLFYLCPAPPPPPTPGVLRSICPPCQSWGGAFANFALPGGGGGLLPTPGPFPSFWHAVSCQNVTTQKVLLGKKQIGSSVKDRNRLKRVVKACSRFYARISTLLIEPELPFFGYWIKLLLILFEEHPFIFIKLFITYKSYNFTTVY